MEHLAIFFWMFNSWIFSGMVLCTGVGFNFLMSQGRVSPWNTNVTRITINVIKSSSIRAVFQFIIKSRNVQLQKKLKTSLLLQSKLTILLHLDNFPNEVLVMRQTRYITINFNFFVLKMFKSRVWSLNTIYYSLFSIILFFMLEFDSLFI